MLGTIANAAAIVVGSVLGMLLKSGGLKENYRVTLNYAVGLAVVFVGASGCIGAMLQEGANPVLYIVALAIGALLGELVRIEARLESLGAWLQRKINSKGEEVSLAKGFVAASLVFCVGTMAIMGSLESGVRGNHTILFAKSLLDGIISLVMASTLGIGVIFSAVSVFLYQGSITLLAAWVSPFLTADMLREISIVGGILIFAIGLNLLELIKIRVGNMLPALLVPIVYYVVIGLL